MYFAVHSYFAIICLVYRKSGCIFMLQIKLFLEFIKIGCLSFGGGFATLPFIYELAEQTDWISLEEINKMITISQMTPGPLACNIATYVGGKLNGILGSFIATISFVIPAIIFMTFIYKIINKFKYNKKLEIILQNIRATTFANLLISCLVIFKIVFLKNSQFISLGNINLKCIILVLFLIPFTKKINLPPLVYIFFSGIIGIIFKFSI